jgi:hypothetical protein
MWGQLTNLTSSIAQQAQELAQEVGLDEQLVIIGQIDKNSINILLLQGG